MDNNLNNETVVKRRDGFTLINHRDEVNIIARRQPVLRDSARGWHESDLAITIDHAALSINANFKAVACFTCSEVLNALTTGN